MRATFSILPRVDNVLNMNPFGYELRTSLPDKHHMKFNQDVLEDSVCSVMAPP
jgi:hypothetical protein